VTHTDVAQAEARLAGAQASLIQAQGALVTSRAAYMRVVGNAPGVLQQPEMPGSLPPTQADAISWR